MPPGESLHPRRTTRRASAAIAAAAVGAVVAQMGACADTAPELPTRLESLVFDTVFQIGAPSGEPWASFEGVWDMDVDADGRLAVLDLGGPAIHVFDAAGEHLGSIDVTGLEAGQIDAPAAVAWNAPGSLLIWDPGASWVSRFSVSESAVTYIDRWRAFAFGETGFCASGDRTYLSYWQDGQIVHEVGPEGITQSFGSAPPVAGGESLGPDLLEIAVEELTPSALLCTSEGVLDVGFVQSGSRLHSWTGTERWSRTFEDFRPVTAYSDDGIGLGRRFDEGEGSHLLRSIVPWGSSMVLVQHELRTREFREEGEVDVVESRLVRLADGAEVARSRHVPPVLAAHGRRLYFVGDQPFPRVTAVDVR